MICNIGIHLGPCTFVQIIAMSAIQEVLNREFHCILTSQTDIMVEKQS